MRQLIDAFEDLLQDVANVNDPSVKDVQKVLDVVDFAADLNPVLPNSLPVVDAQLEAACQGAAGSSSLSQAVCDAALSARDEISWFSSYEEYVGEPDMEALSKQYAGTILIGPNAPIHSDIFGGGLSLQGRDTYYPPHLHKAVERYWIVGGNGDWKINQDPWFAVEPGDTIFHDTGVRHAMQTNAEPLLCVWLWSTDIDSQVIMDRG